MTDLVPGRLIRVPNRQKGQPPILRLVYRTKSGGETAPSSFTPGELSASLDGRSEDEIPVELELVGGKPKRIRPQGEPWIEPGMASPPRPVPSAPRQGGHVARDGSGRTGAKCAMPTTQAFHNPYTFIPSPPRPADGELADAPPASHDRFHPDRYYGRLTVAMTVETPLLVPDAARARELPNGHRIFPVRTRPDGAPDLPPTSVKGMLRAAFEAVTNSRFAVFPGHERRLGYRMASQDGLSMVPARVSDDGKSLELLLGTNSDMALGDDKARKTMFAAWLPRYRPGGGESRKGDTVCYPDGSLPCHGDRVQGWLQKFQHPERNFFYWRVVAVRRAGGGGGATVAPAGPASQERCRTESPYRG